MRKLLLFAALLFILANNRAFAQCSATITALAGTTGCGNRTLTASPIGDVWTQKMSMLSGRSSAAGFSIGNKGYVGTGSTSSSAYSTDFWEYDPATDAWTQKAVFPGVGRQAAVGFSVGSKGYIGTGVDNSNVRHSDFYEYNPATNTWLQKASITNSRSFATAFSIGTKGYVSMGYVSASYAIDLWEYNPATDQWTQKANFGGTGRYSATGFAIGAKGYVGFGSTGTAGTGDFWEYDPTTNLWAQKAGIYGLQLYGARGFGLGNNGYVVGGKDQGTTGFYSSVTYRFDPVLNQWRQAAPNVPNAKLFGVAFVINGRGYLATGDNTSTLYEYEPMAGYAWSNGATTSSVSVGGTATYSVLITTAAGCTNSASQAIATSPNPTLTVSGGSLVCSATSSTLNAGGASSYTWSANAGGGNSTQAVVTPTISTTYTVSGTTGSCTVSYPVSVFVSGAPVGNISVSGTTLGCGPRTLSVNPGGDAWTQKASMSLGHSRPFAFSIGSKGYLGTGTDGSTSKDFWEFDPVANTWTQKADFGGGNRNFAYSFSIGNKGYAGGGYSVSSLYGFAMDFWEYDPGTNAWTRRADVPMIPRFVSLSFAIGNKGYVGTGQDNYGNQAYNDFWEYDPATDLWTQKADIPSVGRTGTAGFAIGNKGYVGTGYPGYPSTTPLTDFWQFDPATNAWSAIAPFPGGVGGYGVGFTIGNRGYITGSFFAANGYGLWEYNPTTNTWTARADFPGPGRQSPVAFVVGNKAYMGAGPNSSSSNSFKDLWQYEPAASFAWSTGATTPSITTLTSGSYSITINTNTGCSVTAVQSLSLSPSPTISVSGNTNAICSGLSATLTAGGAGSYTWSSNAGGGNAASVIVTPTASTTYTVSGSTGACTVDYPVTVSVLPVPSASIALSGPAVGCGTTTLSVNAPPVGWTRKANIGAARMQGVSFSIGSKGYAGLGQNGTGTVNDFWEYDPAANAWTQKANFTPGARYYATGFGIGTKGYVTGGLDNASNAYNDVWEFDPVANSWLLKGTVGVARSQATGFSLNGRGYVAFGANGMGLIMNDLWKYDPATNQWTQVLSFPGAARLSAAAFTIGSKAYIGTGYSNSGNLADVWEFDPLTDTWTSKNPYGGGAIRGGTGFAINNKGYFVGGQGPSVPTNTIWEYDAVLNNWIQKPNFTGVGRQDAAGFAIGNKGYFGLGYTLNTAPLYPNDLWEFEPGSTTLWSNGSTLQAIPVTASGNYSVTVTNLSGCSASSSQSVALSPNPTITVSGVPAVLCQGLSSTLSASGAGSYTWSANAGGGNNTNVVVSPTTTTMYTVSGTTGSCTVNYPVNILVSAIPAATIATSGPTVGCGALSLSVGTTPGNWIQKTGLSTARAYGVSFSIGNKGYTGLGANTSNLIDFWEYDPATDAWTQKANFSGGVRLNAMAFSIGSKGYVAGGFVPSGSLYKNDFWEFDPAANTWVQKTSIPGVGRRYGNGFALNGKGYAGLGTNSSGSALGDIWEYDPVFDDWTQKMNFIGPRTKATVFTIGSLAYVITGMSNTAIMNDMWAFDPIANTWSAKANYAGTGAQLASGFSLGNKGYIGLGFAGFGELNEFWEYNAGTDTWAQKNNFSGAARQATGVFAIGNKGYIAMGYNTLNAPNYKNDLWEYHDAVAINWSTGSTLQAITVSASGNYSVTLTNSNGCSASSSQSVSLSPNPTVSVSGYTNTLCSGGTSTLTASGAGTYTWSANAGGGNAASAIVSPSVSTLYTVSATTGICTVDYPVYVSVIAVPAASILMAGSSTVCGAAVTLSTNPGVSNVWAQKTGITTTRNYAAGFSVNGKGYVGTGMSGTTILSDFWEYDATANTWSQKAGFGGGARYGAVGISIGNKGYIGTGFDGTAGLHKNDFWEYDPAANTWTQKASFGGAVRRQATGFSIGDKGYVGMGWDGVSVQNDLWEYNQATNVWTQKSNITTARYSALGVSLGTKGYVGGGQLISGGGSNEFWEYNPAADAWTQKANIGTTSLRVGAVAFAIGNSIIVSGGNTLNDTYEYNATTNTWTARANFAGLYRSNAVAFAINGKGYVATGNGSSVYSDVWEYSPATGILWSTSATTPTISVTTTGTYSVTLTNVAGCTSGTSQAISITPTPTVSISGLGTICNGSAITLTANGAASYTWSANAGSATTNTVMIAPSTSTSYVVTGATNGCTASAIKNIMVNAVPVVTAASSATSVCQGFNITLNGGGAASYTWTGGATDNLPFAPNATTDYTVTGATVNNCTNTAVVSVTVKPSPTVTVNSGTICQGQSFTINPNGAISYTYSGGSSVVTPNSTTSYSVTGSNAIGCTNAIPAVSTVTVNAVPVISAASGVVCAGSSYTINPTGAASYTYSSGSSVVTPANTSTYGITGASAAGCLSASQTVITVTVSALPVVSVSGGTLCNGQSFTLNPTGATTYTYLPGGSAVVSPAANTTYSVTGANAFGCVSAATATAGITVLVSPTVSVNSGSVCAGRSFTLNPTGAVSYTYSGGSAIVTPGSTSSYTVTGINAAGCTNAVPATATVTVYALPVVSANSGVLCGSGSYTIVPSGAVSYTYSGGSNIVSPAVTSTYGIAGSSSVGCVSSSSAIITVTVSALPILTVSSGSICSGNSVSLNPSGAAVYTIIPGGSAVVSPNTSATYSVTGANALGCLSAAPAISSVTVYALPVVTVNSGSICAGSSFTLNPSGAASYTYSGGFAIVSPNTSSAYSVTGTSANGCVSALPAIGNVTVYTLPALSANSATICSGQSFTINPAGAATYTYSNGSAIVSPVVPTSYTVSGTSAEGCVGNPVVLTVSVQPTLTVSISGSATVCEGQAIVLTASGANTYAWSTGANSASVSVTPLTGTVYNVNATSGVCTASASQSVSVIPVAPLQIDYSTPLLCAGETTSIVASGADLYTWSDGSAFSVIVISPTVTTSYTVTGINLNGCNSSSVVTQQVSPCDGLAESGSTDAHITVYPNPNNGFVTISATMFPEHASVALYNYLGQLISSETLTGTESQLHFENAANGVYTLRISANGKPVSVIQLIKH